MFQKFSEVRKILRVAKKFSEVRKNSQKWENKTLEALQSIAPNSAQTIQNYQTTQKEDLKNSQIQENTIDQKNECINTQIESSKKTEQSELSNKGNFPRGVIQDNSEELEIDYRFGIPEELKKRLQRVDIHLDRKVVDAIACHDISQVLGALNHIENTRDNIKNTRSVFLFQLPKQPIEKLGARLPEIGSAMAMEIKQLEEVSKTPEYQQKRKEHFEIIKATLKKNASTG